MGEVAPGIHRFGDWFVNWYLVEDEGEVTIVDAGEQHHWDSLLAGLDSLGHERDKVKALLLTHADVDHIGFAERAREELHVRVYVHEDEAEFAAGKERPREGGMWRYARYPAGVKLFARFARPGRLDRRPVRETTKFRDGDVLSVPGKPRAIHMPGHAPGLSAFLFEERGVLVSGDSLVTRNTLTGRRGPQVMPSALNTSTDEAFESLRRLEDIDAGRLLPGHGEPWSGKLSVAVERAREAGRS